MMTTFWSLFDKSYAVSTFDLNILPIHRVNGQESAELPGLMALTPPRKTGRGREHDTLIVYLTLSGNATLSSFELHDLLKNTGTKFHQTSGSLTSAMRKAVENINTTLLERNLSTSGRGLQAFGRLALAVIRREQCTLLLSGPVHAVWVSDGKSRHIHDPALSGKGLGSSQSIQSYFSQVELNSQDLLALCGKFPKDWEADLLNERPPASLEASYRKLTLTQGDLNAALIQAHSGHGTITILRPEASLSRAHRSQPTVVETPAAAPAVEEVTASPTSDPQTADSVPTDPLTEEQIDALAGLAAHMVQPSAYAIPPQPESIVPASTQENLPSTPRTYPPSIPRTKWEEPISTPVIESTPQEEEEDEGPELIEEPILVKSSVRKPKSNAHAEATHQMAKVMVGGIHFGRSLNERFQAFGGKFLPRLLPGAAPNQEFALPTYVLVFIAVVIPVLVVTIASVVYLRFGQSVQYEELYSQALNQRAAATSETDPVRQRDAWLSVLTTLDKADTYRQTDESQALRADAQTNLDGLMGIVRLDFIPAFPNGVSGTTQISRLAASESELYMLDAERGDVRHASFSGQGLSIDSTFSCEPGTYAGYQVGTLVDILALPKVNALGATVLGIDATGTLLYCAPGQVPQAIPLPSLPNTNWQRITALALDSGNLYVLDATSRAIWVFVGKDSAFTDTPYFYFGNQIPTTIDSAIDMSVSGDDLYLLHADGHLSTCTYSRISDAPTRCQDPAPRINNYPAHRDIDIFALAHFTQIALTNPPNPVVLLLDSDRRSVYRLSPRSLEYQNQVTGYAGEDNPFQAGPATAMAVSPNYVLYLAIGNQVYFATNLP
ncbi:MAG TPA: hypothetical protein VJ785_06025 [Anaerolineales bacterium]|nr:hypothetical protein [Anaerolineales bacterium]